MKRLLFATDFSWECSQAAGYIGQRVGQLGAKLTVLHVFDPDKVYYHAGDLALRPQHEILEDLITVHRQKLDQFVAEHFMGISLDPKLKIGDRIEEIGRVAQKENIDAIMLPLKHHNLLSEKFSYSLPAQILELFNLPVWTIDPKATPLARSKAAILCSLDFHQDGALDEQNKRILDAGTKISRALNAPLNLLHVLSERNMEQRRHGSSIVLTHLREEQLSRVRKELGAEAKYLVRAGTSLADVIATSAREVDAGLVITGRSHTRPLLSASQAPILRITQLCPCPVLSIC